MVVGVADDDLDREYVTDVLDEEETESSEESVGERVIDLASGDKLSETLNDFDTDGERDDEIDAVISLVADFVGLLVFDDVWENEAESDNVADLSTAEIVAVVDGSMEVDAEFVALAKYVDEGVDEGSAVSESVPERLLSCDCVVVAE